MIKETGTKVDKLKTNSDLAQTKELMQIALARSASRRTQGMEDAYSNVPAWSILKACVYNEDKSLIKSLRLTSQAFVHLMSKGALGQFFATRFTGTQLLRSIHQKEEFSDVDNSLAIKSEFSESNNVRRKIALYGSGDLESFIAFLQIPSNVARAKSIEIVGIDNVNSRNIEKVQSLLDLLPSSVKTLSFGDISFRVKLNFPVHINPKVLSFRNICQNAELNIPLYTNLESLTYDHICENTYYKVPNFPNLKFLVIGDIKRKATLDLSSPLLMLESLYIGNMGSTKFEKLKMFNFPKLKFLSLGNFPDDSKTTLPEFQMLESICLGNLYGSSKMILPKYPNLTSFSIGDMDQHSKLSLFVTSSLKSVSFKNVYTLAGLIFQGCLWAIHVNSNGVYIDPIDGQTKEYSQLSFQEIIKANSEVNPGYSLFLPYWEKNYFNVKFQA